MRYIVYFTRNDGQKDFFHCENAKERDLEIREMLESDNFIFIAYERLYKSGKLGKRTVVLDYEEYNR